MKRVIGVFVCIMATCLLSFANDGMEAVLRANSHVTSLPDEGCQFVLANNIVTGYCEQSLSVPVANNIGIGRRVSPFSGGSTPMSTAQSPQEELRNCSCGTVCRCMGLLQDLPGHSARYYIYALRRIRI